MDQERITQIRGAAAAAWQRFHAWAVRVPAKAWVVLGLFLFAAVLMALHTAVAGKDAVLRLKVQHNFRSARLSLWLDGDLACSAKLSGSLRKKYGLIPDSVGGSLSQTVPVPSGQHQVRVRVESEDGAVGEDIISGDFARNSERTLSVSARRSDVSLSWQGSSSAVAESSSSSPAWFGRYAGTLLLTIAGSIISALTGYALRELPGHIRSRQDATPKA